jgi:hypothetical protein
MHRPCITRKKAKAARLGAWASRVVGIASRTRLIKMPRLRSRLLERYPTARPETSIPKVLALEASPICPGVTP